MTVILPTRVTPIPALCYGKCEVPIIRPTRGSRMFVKTCGRDGFLTGQAECAHVGWWQVGRPSPSSATRFRSPRAVGPTGIRLQIGTVPGRRDRRTRRGLRPLTAGAKHPIFGWLMLYVSTNNHPLAISHYPNECTHAIRPQSDGVPAHRWGSDRFVQLATGATSWRPVHPQNRRYRSGAPRR
jgi:hypothetical protein